MPAPAHPTSAAANLRAALGLLLALQRQGLRRLVLCPGSRSAPLAVAAGLLERRGLELVTGIDERSAAFLALGLGRVDGRPAAVVTTSGTAVANLLPAAVEADHGNVPLLLLTADRPARLKGCGANQTVNQEQFLTASCRAVLAGDPRGLAAMVPADLADLARQAWKATLAAPVGPVQLNLPFEEPLHIGAEALAAQARNLAALEAELAAGEGRPAPAGGSPPDAGSTTPSHPFGGLDPDRAGVVVAGPWRGSAAALEGFTAALGQWQRRTGWPVLADALSGLRGWPGLDLIAGYDLVLTAPPGNLAPPQLLRLGPLPASRRLQQWIADAPGPQLLIGEDEPRNLDATGSATARRGDGLEAWILSLGPSLREGGPGGEALALAQRWRQAEALTQSLLDRALAGAAATEPALARRLSRLLPAERPLMLASSSPVRDWESFSDPAAPQRRVHGFRGASGIDGTLSIAAGLALAEGRLVLLTGDLALLHDANGWLWHRQLAAAGAGLTVVLVENGGGGIFEQLPIRLEPSSPEASGPVMPSGGPAGAGTGGAGGTPLDFERLFAMPQPLDHGALAAVHGIPVRRLADLEDLAGALTWAEARPVALIEVRTRRRADAELRRELRQAVAGALAAEGPA